MPLLPLQQRIEVAAGAGEFRRQAQQFRDPPVHHRHAPPLIDHQDALADIFDGHRQSLVKPRQPMPLPERDQTDGRTISDSNAPASIVSRRARSYDANAAARDTPAATNSG